MTRALATVAVTSLVTFLLHCSSPSTQRCVLDDRCYEFRTPEGTDPGLVLVLDDAGAGEAGDAETPDGGDGGGP